MWGNLLQQEPINADIYKVLATCMFIAKLSIIKNKKKFKHLISKSDWKYYHVTVYKMKRKVDIRNYILIKVY